MKTIHYFILNLLLAVLWIILNREGNIFHFLLGYGIGFFILWAFQYLLKTAAYVRTVKNFVKFVFIFTWLFLRSNLNMVKIILFTPKNKINPSFISYPIHDLSYFEALLMSQLITLTPGSVSTELEKKVLWIHLIDLKDPQQEIQNINNLKNLITGFTR